MLKYQAFTFILFDYHYQPPKGFRPLEIPFALS